MWRSPWDEVMAPRPAPRPVLGAFRIGVLARLMASARNSSRLFSVIANCFWRLKSTVCRPDILHSRTVVCCRLYGRLRPDATEQHAQAEVSGLFRRLRHM